MKLTLEKSVKYTLFLYAFVSTMSITAAEISYILAIVIAAADIIKNKKPIKALFISALTIPLVVFAATHAAAAFSGIDPLNSVKALKKLYIFLMFFIAGAYFTDEEDVKKAIHFFTAGASVTGMYAVISMIFFRFIKGIWNYRPSSFSGNHMHCGGMLMAAVIIITAAALYFLSRKEYRAFGLYAIALLVTGTGLLFTLTRGSWLGAFAGVLIVLLAIDRKKALVFIGALIVLAFSLKSTIFFERALSSLNLKKASSVNERIYMWQSGIEMIKDRPLLGVGAGNVARVYPEYRNRKSIDRDFFHLHNNLIHIGAMDGLAGVSAFLLIFLVLWRSLYKSVFSEGSIYMKYIITGVFAYSIAFFINGMFEYNFFASQVVLIFWFFMGFLGAGKGKASAV